MIIYIFSKTLIYLALGDSSEQTLYRELVDWWRRRDRWERLLVSFGLFILQVNVAPAILDFERELIHYIGRMYSGASMKDLAILLGSLLLVNQIYISYKIKKMSKMFSTGVDEE